MLKYESNCLFFPTKQLPRLFNLRIGAFEQKCTTWLDDIKTIPFSEKCCQLCRETNSSDCMEHYATACERIKFMRTDKILKILRRARYLALQYATKKDLDKQTAPYLAYVLLLGGRLDDETYLQGVSTIKSPLIITAK